MVPIELLKIKPLAVGDDSSLNPGIMRDLGVTENADRPGPSKPRRARQNEKHQNDGQAEEFLTSEGRLWRIGYR
jgi:hypothetical protein